MRTKHVLLRFLFCFSENAKGLIDRSILSYLVSAYKTLVFAKPIPRLKTQPINATQKPVDYTVIRLNSSPGRQHDLPGGKMLKFRG